MLSPNFNPFPDLQTERLVLRRIVASDATAILHLRSDERVMQFIDRPRAKTIEDAIELIGKIDASIETNDGINWGISLKGNPELIGTIAFWRIDKPNYRAEIGYMLAHEFHGKGLMQEAISTVIKFGFEQMQLHSIEANVNPGNIISKKLLEKNGFVQEAYFKENYYFNGRFLDSAIYSLVVKERTEGGRPQSADR